MSDHVDSASQSPERWRGRAGLVNSGALRSLAVVCASVIFLVPVNFVAPNRAVQVVVGLALVAALGQLVLVAAVRGGRQARVAAQVLLAFALFWAAASGDPQGVLGLIAPLASGLVLGFTARSRIGDVILTVALVNGMSLIADFLYGPGFVSSIFGELLFNSNLEASTRARGILGQPVPAGIVASVVTVVLVGLYMAKRVSGVAALVGAAISLVGLWLSGTRSGIVILALGLLLLWPSSRTRMRAKVRPGRLIASLVIIATVLLAYGPIARAVGRERIFAFGELSGTVSLTNRQMAPEVLSLWAETCSGICAVAGSGPRSLQEYMSQYLGYYGVSTVDNLYVSVLWDAGIVGIAAMVLLLATSARVILGRQYDRAGRVCAAGVLMVLASGMFFDALYVNSVAVLTGVLGATVITAERRRVVLDEDPPQGRR